MCFSAIKHRDIFGLLRVVVVKLGLVRNQGPAKEKAKRRINLASVDEISANKSLLTLNWTISSTDRIG